MANGALRCPLHGCERARIFRPRKKSVFLAHASTLRTPTELAGFISHLTSLPALKKATHCMYAYRIVPDVPTPSVKMVGQHDGGEKGSGERLSRLLEALQCTNVVVVVSRWYGGVKLGSDRWKLISTVAKEALYKGNFAKELPLNGTNVATPKQNTKRRK
ncbi:ribosomal protein S5 domain 2-like protein [Agrocybe pediades]|nr:ribosomal protein S5 domain 2-like protein [Agrocybe pediades]